MNENDRQWGGRGGKGILIQRKGLCSEGALSFPPSPSRVDSCDASLSLSLWFRISDGTSSKNRGARSAQGAEHVRVRRKSGLKETKYAGIKFDPIPAAKLAGYYGTQGLNSSVRSRLFRGETTRSYHVRELISRQVFVRSSVLAG